jgi:hypothetical protein
MNKKSQTGPSMISIIFYTFIFIILWAVFFSQQLATWGHIAVVNGGYTGIEALFYENLNFLIMFVLIIFILAVGFLGRTQ